MYRVYSHILKNGSEIASLISDKIHSDLSDAVISTSILTSYIPIPPDEVTNFAMTLTNKIKEEFEKRCSLETDIIYVSIVRKKSRVITFLDFEYRTYPNFKLVAEVTLELPKYNCELMFNLTEEIKDFFQENLC